MKPSADPVLADLASRFADQEAGAGEDPALDQLVRDSLRDTAAVEPASLPTTPRPSTSPASDAAEALLEVLHQDYLRTLEDPQHPGSATAWTRPTGGTQGLLADELERLKAEASHYRGLYDLMAPPPRVDELMRGLDTGTSVDDLLAAESPDSVLHLLAPSSHRTTGDAGDLLALTDTAVLPALTRKEHHDLALDSAIGSLLAAPATPPSRHEP